MRQNSFCKSQMKSDHNESGSVSAEITVGLYTVGEISRDPDLFGPYCDPRSYLPRDLAAWRDLVISNPYAEKDDLALILVLKGNVIAGRLGFYGASAVCGGSERRTYWMDGFFVEREARQMGIGGVMMRVALRRCRSLLGCGGPSPEAQKLFKTAGMQELPRLRRFVYFFNAKPIVGWYLQNRFIRSISAALLTPLVKVYYELRRRPLSTPLTFKPVSQFSPKIDDLPPPPAPNYFPRPARLLNWVLSHRRIWAFEIYRREELLGYCLLKRIRQGAGWPHYLPEMTVGCLLDVHLRESTPEVAASVLSFVLCFFRQRRVDVLECQVDDATMENLCRHYGMIHVGGFRVFFRPPPGHTLDPAALWHLTFGTGDVLLMGE